MAADAPAPRTAHAGLHWRIWAAEGAATFLLLLLGLSAACLVFGEGAPVAGLLHSGSARLLLVGALFSAVNSLLIVSPLGRLSGAHMNPVVTLSFRVLGRVGGHDVAGYLAAQLLGAVAAAALVRLSWGRAAESISGGATLPAVSAPAAVGLEAAMTAALIAVILIFVSSARLARWTALALWPLVALLVRVGGSSTGTSLNPTRSLAPALVFDRLGSIWIYLLGPTAGALAVALAWGRLGMTRPKTAKLFHDPRYACSLASELPAMPPAARGQGKSAPRYERPASTL